MSERWYTPMGRNWKISRPGLWMFLNIWCLFDVVLFPLTFILTEFLGDEKNCQVSFSTFKCCIFLEKKKAVMLNIDTEEFQLRNELLY